VPGQSGRRVARRVVGAVTVAVGFLAVTAGGALAVERPSAPPAATALVDPSPAQVERVMTPVTSGDSLGELQRTLMSEFSASFGGIYVGTGGQYVVATAGPAPAELESAVTAGLAAAESALGTRAGPASTMRISYAETGTSLWALYRLKAAILDNPALRAAGVDGAGLDIRHGRVVVMTTGTTGAAAVRVDYGAAVELLSGGSSQLTASRYSDSDPWNGGDQIVTPSDGETTCTSGFGMQDEASGQRYLLTAGHCGAATWYNTRTATPVYSSSTLIGTTLSGSVNTSTVDSQLIATDSSCVSWGDKSTKTSNANRIYITGYANPPQGASIELEGATSLEENGTVSYYDVSKVIEGEDLDDLDLVTAVPDMGDSGGPMIYPTGFGPLAGGTVVGWYDNNGNVWGVVQLIDAETYVYTALLGAQVVPNASTTGDSC
jgi:streptogrisin C